MADDFYFGQSELVYLQKLNTLAESVNMGSNQFYEGQQAEEYLIRLNLLSDALIGGGNNAPSVSNDSFTTDHNTALALSASQLLANDSDSDGDTLTITGVGSALNCAAEWFVNQQQITFQPNTGFSGTASFVYYVSDGTETSSGTVSVVVAASTANNVPIAVADNFTALHNESLLFSEAQLVGNDTDLDGDTLTITGVSNASNCLVSWLPNTSQVSFAPVSGFSGEATFIYTITDGTDTANGLVTVDVASAVLDTTAPVTGDDASLLNSQGSSVTLNVFINDTDNIGIVNDSFAFTGTLIGAFTIVSDHEMISTNNGTWTYLNGYVTYTPSDESVLEPPYALYTVEDAAGNVSNQSTIQVTYVASIPSAANNAISVQQDTTSIVPAIELTWGSKRGSLLGSYDQTYYIDFDTGLDTNTGTSTGAPWKHSPFDVNATNNAVSPTLTGGTLIKFKGGVVYRGEISLISQTLNITFDGNSDGNWGIGQAIIDGSMLVTGWSNSTDTRFATTTNLKEATVVSRVNSITANAYDGDKTMILAQSIPMADPYEYQDVKGGEYYDFPQTDLTLTTLRDPIRFTSNDQYFYDEAVLKIWIYPNLVHDVRVQSYNPATNTITFNQSLPANAIPDTSGGQNPDYVNHKYVLSNHPSVVARLGDYCIINSKIYAYLEDTSNIRVSILQKGFYVELTDNVTIQWFDIRNFSGDDGETGMGTGIKLIDSDNALIQHNRVRYMKSYEWTPGIDLTRVDNSHVNDSWIHQAILASGLGAFGDNVGIRRNHIQNMGMDGMRLFTLTNSVVEDNVVVDQYGIHGNGVACYLFCSNLTLQRNFIRHKLFALTTQKVAVGGMVVKNNVIISTMTTTGSSRVVANYQDSTNLKYYNNVMMGTGNALGLFVQDSSNVGFEAKNNVMTGMYTLTSGASIKNNIYTSLHYTQTESTLEATDTLITDLSTLFVDASKQDYRPKQNSLMLSNGGDGIVSTHDFSGNAISVSSSYKGADSIANSARQAAGQGLELSSIAAGAHGDMTIGYNRFVEIVPDTGYAGADAYVYTMQDATANSATGQINVTFTSYDSPPVAVDDSATLPYESTSTLTKSTIIANDYDINSDVINIVSVTQAAKANIVLLGNQDITVEPTGYGLTNFTYSIEANGQQSTATVNLTISDPLAGTPSLNFDGIETYASFTSVTLSGEFNVSFDVTFNAISTVLRGVFAQFVLGDNSAMSLSQSGEVKFRLQYTSSAQINVGAFTVDQTYKFTVLRDAANIVQIKIDDVVQHTYGSILGDLTIGVVGTANNLAITYFDGIIKDLQIIDGQSPSASYAIDSASVISEPASFGAGTMTFSNVIASDWTIPVANQAPTAPTNLVAVVLSDTAISLNWTAGTDDVAVVSYNIYQCNDTQCVSKTLISNEAALSYTVTGLLEDTLYYLSVESVDEGGLVSALSNIVNGMTLAANNAPTTSPVSATAYFGIPKIISKAELLANASDADGDALSITAVNTVSGGTASLNADQSITFTDDGTTPETITYTVSDGTDTVIGTVNISVIEEPFRTYVSAGQTSTIAVVVTGNTHNWEASDGFTQTAGDLAHLFVSAGSVDFLLTNSTDLTNWHSSNNQHTGALPSLTNNTALSYWHSGGNQHTGSLPSLTNNTALSYWRSANNQHTGSLPSLTNNTALSYWHSGGNQHTGSLPNLTNNTALTNWHSYDNQHTGSLPSLTNNTALSYWHSGGNQHTGSLPSLTNNTALTYWYSYDNQHTGALPSLTNNTALSYWHSYDNQHTGALPSLTNNTALSYWRSYNNQHTSFVGGLPSSCAVYDVNNNDIDLVGINNLLAAAVASKIGAATKINMDLSGGTNAVPTGQGLTDKATLIADGHTITTN